MHWHNTALQEGMLHCCAGLAQPSAPCWEHVLAMCWRCAPPRVRSPGLPLLPALPAQAPVKWKLDKSMVAVWEQVVQRQGKNTKAGSSSSSGQELAGAAVQDCYSVTLEVRVEMVAAEVAAGGSRRWRLRDAAALPSLALYDGGKQRLIIGLAKVGLHACD